MLNLKKYLLVGLCFYIQNGQGSRSKNLYFPITGPHESETCTRKSDNSPGECTSLLQCPKAIEIYKKYGIRPDICEWRHKLPIICCSNQNLYNLMEYSDYYRNLIHYVPHGISERKCNEYNNLQFTSRFLRVQTTVFGAGEFPHMAAIGWTGYHNNVNWKCGGSLISENYVLTAAHCVSSDLDGIPDVVRLTDQNIKHIHNGVNPQDFRIIEIIKHPQYIPESYYDDIALLLLDRHVKFTENVRPACLWQTYLFNQTQAILSSWGHVEFGGYPSENLLKANLQLINETQCNQNFPVSDRLEFGLLFDQLCAGDITGQQDACHGNSGGPLQIQTFSNYKRISHIIGITSFRRSCESNSPGVYTRVSSYINWIEKIVWPNKY